MAGEEARTSLRWVEGQVVERDDIVGSGPDIVADFEDSANQTLP